MSENLLRKEPDYCAIHMCHHEGCPDTDVHLYLVDVSGMPTTAYFCKLHKKGRPVSSFEDHDF